MKKLSSFSELKSLGNNVDEDIVKDNQDKTIKQFLEAHYSKKGRAGKPVIIIKGFKGNLNDIKTLAKILKNKCGVGGSIKNDEILIQGDVRDKITQILLEMGHDVKRIGG